MSKDLESVFKSNLKRAQEFSDSQISTLMTLNEAAKSAQTSKAIHKAIVEAARLGGYEIIISGDESLGFPLVTDQRLNGKDKWGSIIPIRPDIDDLTEQDEVFLNTYAGRAGLYIDHVHLYESLRRTKQELERTVNDQINNRGNLAHELKGPLQVLVSAVSMLRRRFPQENEMYNQMLDMGKSATEQMKDLIELLNLTSMDPQELRDKGEIVYPEEVARGFLTMWDYILKENNIEARLKFDRNNGEEFPIFTNKAAYKVLWGTFTGDSILYAKEGSRIYQGVRVVDDQLEIISENQYQSEKRKLSIGYGKGRGMRFIRELVTTKLKGEFEIIRDKSIISNNYEHCEHFGSTNTVYDPSNYVFALRIRIPMSELKPERKE